VAWNLKQSLASEKKYTRRGGRSLHRASVCICSACFITHVCVCSIYMFMTTHSFHIQIHLVHGESPQQHGRKDCQVHIRLHGHEQKSLSDSQYHHASQAETLKVEKTPQKHDRTAHSSPRTVRRECMFGAVVYVCVIMCYAICVYQQIPGERQEEHKCVWRQRRG
jgi:hypothetical protein